MSAPFPTRMKSGLVGDMPVWLADVQPMITQLALAHQFIQRSADLHRTVAEHGGLPFMNDLPADPSDEEYQFFYANQQVLLDSMKATAMQRSYWEDTDRRLREAMPSFLHFSSIEFLSQLSDPSGVEKVANELAARVANDTKVIATATTPTTASSSSTTPTTASSSSTTPTTASSSSTSSACIDAKSVPVSASSSSSSSSSSSPPPTVECKPSTKTKQRCAECKMVASAAKRWTTWQPVGEIESRLQDLIARTEREFCGDEPTET